MGPTPAHSQSPQASASTNSAIRASSVVDGVSQENPAESSGEHPNAVPHCRNFHLIFNSNDGCTDSIPSVVYIVRGTDPTRVKIGKSRDLRKRLADLDASNSHPLTVLAVIFGYTNVEKRLHRVFAKQRLHNEWFAVSSELAQFIFDAASDPGLSRRRFPEDFRRDEVPHGEYIEGALGDENEIVGGDELRDEADVLARWRNARGHELEPVIEIEWADLDSFDRYKVDQNRGVWVNDADRIFHSEYVGINRIASQLVDIADRHERMLGFIFAAQLGRDVDPGTYGRYRNCLWDIMERRTALWGNARHALPIEFHSCKTCRAWGDGSAVSSGEWLARLAHRTRIGDLRLARIVGQPGVTEVLR